MAKGRPYKDARVLTRWLSGSLVIFAVISAIAMVFDVGHALLMQIALAGDISLLRFVYINVALNKLTSWLFLLVFIVTATVFASWVWRMHTNALALKIVGVRTKPAMAAAAYIIPVVNLWKPYRAMRELWQTDAPAVLLTCWWAMWLVFQATASVGIYLDLWGSDIVALRNRMVAAAASDVAALVAAVAAAILVNKVYRLHARMTESVLTRAFD